MMYKLHVAMVTCFSSHLSLTHRHQAGGFNQITLWQRFQKLTMYFRNPYCSQTKVNFQLSFLAGGPNTHICILPITQAAVVCCLLCYFEPRRRAKLLQQRMETTHSVQLTIKTYNTPNNAHQAKDRNLCDSIPLIVVYTEVLDNEGQYHRNFLHSVKCQCTF